MVDDLNEPRPPLAIMYGRWVDHNFLKCGLTSCDILITRLVFVIIINTSQIVNYQRPIFMMFNFLILSLCFSNFSSALPYEFGLIAITVGTGYRFSNSVSAFTLSLVSTRASPLSNRKVFSKDVSPLLVKLTSFS